MSIAYRFAGKEVMEEFCMKFFAADNQDLTEKR